MRSKVLFSILVGVVTILMSFYWSKSYWLDINPPLCSARHLLQGLEPYTGCAPFYGDIPATQYPMTTILAFLPLVLFPDPVPAALFWGLTNALLSFGIMQTAQPWRFLIFASGPYAMAFLFHQLSPFIAAVMLLPSLLPLALIKPQTALPVVLTNLTIRRALACLAFIALTFVIYPRWLWVWWSLTRQYDGVIPLLLLPFGPLITLALLRPRSRDAWTLFLYACIPQRSMYDLVPLMLLPHTRWQTITIVFLSWMPLIAMLIARQSVDNVNLSITFIYLPLLIMQLAPIVHLPFYEKAS